MMIEEYFHFFPLNQFYSQEILIHVCKKKQQMLVTIDEKPCYKHLIYNKRFSTSILLILEGKTNTFGVLF